MKIAVIGADGQLGSDIVAACRADGHGGRAPDHRPGGHHATTPRCSARWPTAGADVVVNTAAMHQVEKCEADPARAFAVNALGARRLALAANALGARLVHISTDYVFDGAKLAPYLESDCPLPLNAYGNSKLAGELFVRSLAEKHYVIRVSGLYGKNPCLEKGGLNFVDLMLKLGARAQGSARGRRRGAHAHLDPRGGAPAPAHAARPGPPTASTMSRPRAPAPGTSSPPRSSA